MNGIVAEAMDSPAETVAAALVADAPAPTASAPAAAREPTTERLETDAEIGERTRVLEENSRRLRETAERLERDRRERKRLERVRAPPPRMAPAELSRTKEDGAASQFQIDGLSPTPVLATTGKWFLEMRRKIAQLDEVNEVERERLEQEQVQAEYRRRAQEEFERSVQEKTERNLRELQKSKERELAERERREEEERVEREAREARRQAQSRVQREESRRLEEKARSARSDAAQMKWQVFEEELDRQWAEQEAEEKRRVDHYASLRQRQYQDFDRRLASERKRFGTDAEFCAAYRQTQAKNAANADELFYGTRGKPPWGGGGHEARPPPCRPPPCGSGPTSAGGYMDSGAKEMPPEERAVLKELQSVRSAPRDSQKAKVKELLLRWHPDKNPESADKATRVFQFVQRQRGIVLGI
eukprot:gnl/TRDRNA2_/TRDRNA2_152919_c0_seq1.p1 gnl/TRDRNA2_/TRDRNA2_152919_c0~~gnl/TRDRNA2_/TRDRNA2_152919_c0_seq1.p1  ORF type:complete len:416 (+),score=108.37 gnl/TRDRNA2_/TRDRNA2_152919_c0_seq1:594-1841(+)